VTAFGPGGYALLQQIIVETAMKSNRSFSLDIEEARRRLEAWRKSRSRGKRIPAALLALAAAFVERQLEFTTALTQALCC
jgi:predicted nucleic acid-binding protein